MRLLVVTDQWFPDYAGGSARVAAETAIRLARRGHRVDVLAPAAGAGTGASGDGRRAAEEDVPGLRVLRLLRRGALPQSIADPLAAYREARRLPGPYDLVVAHQATVAAGAARAHPRTPLALVFHASARREHAFDRAAASPGAPPAARAAASATGRALGATLGLLERDALRRAAAILVLSAFSRGLVLEDAPLAADRLRLVSGGVDTDAFAPGHDEARRRLAVPDSAIQLLTVRRLDARMGLEALLDAMAPLVAAEPRLRLAIAGTGPLAGALRDRAGALGLAGTVTFLGRVPEEELVDWYRAADLFVLPTAAYEGFGLVTAEALACGTPVVGTPVGATPELLAPLSPALVAAGSDAASLMAAVRATLPALGPGLRSRCREHAVSHFAWDRVIDLWEDALATAAAAPGAAPAPSTFGAAPRDFPAATRR